MVPVLAAPGYEFSNEITELTFDAEGLLGMANAGADTNGSQFFITYAAQPTLDGGYTVFGKVLEGMDVVQALNPVDPQQGGKLADSDFDSRRSDYGKMIETKPNLSPE